MTREIPPAESESAGIGHDQIKILVYLMAPRPTLPYLGVLRTTPGIFTILFFSSVISCPHGLGASCLGVARTAPWRLIGAINLAYIPRRGSSFILVIPIGVPVGVGNQR